MSEPMNRVRQAWLSLVFVLANMLCLQTALAQSLLPHIDVHGIRNSNVLNWTSGYASIHRIGVQRSMDSLYNYATIGYVPDPDKKVNSYTDRHPDGYRFYRLFIFMSNGQYFFSDPARVNSVSSAGLPAASAGLAPVAGAFSARSAWRPSPYVFTNQNGNVSIRLDTAQGARYRLRILDVDGQALFDLDGICRPNLTLDKSNFMRSGWYHFELFENGKLSDSSRFFIPDSVSSGRNGGN